MCQNSSPVFKPKILNMLRLLIHYHNFFCFLSCIFLTVKQWPVSDDTVLHIATAKGKYIFNKFKIGKSSKNFSVLYRGGLYTGLTGFPGYFSILRYSFLFTFDIIWWCYLICWNFYDGFILRRFHDHNGLAKCLSPLVTESEWPQMKLPFVHGSMESYKIKSRAQFHKS